KMDFHTRDQYRHAVERIAKHSVLSEKHVAELAIESAKRVAEKNGTPGTVHVGYFLIGKGAVNIEKEAKMRLTFAESIKKIISRIPLSVYIGAIFILTALLSWGLVAKAYQEGFRDWVLAGFGVIFFLAASQLATSLINWLTTILSEPSLLPRMDFSKGIPTEYRTMVVIPAIISNSRNIQNLVENLEVRFLANRDANLSFALLTDLKDAKEGKLEEDGPLLEMLQSKIVALNRKYERPVNDTFFLFHRPRRWNARDKIWMGYERKRGKLEELNALIKGYGKDSFSVIVGDESIYASVKYIITLDADTQLPRDVAWKMIGTMAHPLNYPVYSSKKRRVVEGYSILQPRVSNSLPAAPSSLYSKIHGNEPATDPYTRATSDVYQDMFGEGSFIGKGIYEVETFEKTLHGRFPENRILSHDLLEGSYSRSGLITDVQLYEEYPSSYMVDMQRRHRWIRGDWQIASWFTPIVPGPDKKLYKNPLSALSRWKIFDNLRRSLVPVSLLAMLLIGWLVFDNPVFWSVAVLSIVFLPPVTDFTWQLFRKPSDVIFIQHLIYSSRSFKDNLIQHLINIICLPYEAFVNIHAILLTIWRIFISRRNLLQWNPYVDSQASLKIIGKVYRQMWFAPFISLVVFGWLVVYFNLTIAVAFPFLVAWFCAPLLVWYISLPAAHKKTEISGEQVIYLRKLARKIWAFFENFVGKEDNWLPPDNYQEHPVDRIAHRTSPTNVGLYLLSNLSACDFGYITNSILVERSSNTLNTLDRMEKYRGHLYNWYDTVSLLPMSPRYISTVDSGNFVGSLLTLRQAILKIPDTKILQENVFEGLLDTIAVLTEKVPDIASLKKLYKDVQENYSLHTNNAAALKNYLDEIDHSVKEILLQSDLDTDDEGGWWAEKLVGQITGIRQDLLDFFPWLFLPPCPSRFESLLPDLPALPTLNQLARIEESILQKIIDCYYPENITEENKWLDSFRTGIAESARRAKELLLRASLVEGKCRELSAIEFDFLFDKSQNLLAIGYNGDEHRRDNSFYDLLASEARLASFIAIAQGKLPQQSWFALGRQLTNAGTTPILLSWSGSMFEYLMPLLVMPTYENTLLDQTYQAVIQKQIDYGKKRGVPWGISESGYNMVDANLNYQYRAFGVPGIGFKRGLGEDLVIAPYATIMALMVAPEDAYNNLQTMKGKGFEGKYGFYEAIDYSPSRLPRRTAHTVIRSFMAHHQGMAMLSITYLLLDKPMQKRFESHEEVRSALLLLQERIPRVTTFYSPTVHEADISVTPGGLESMRVINTPHTPIPEVQLLSNGRYHVMVTNAGGGYSRWKNMALTRWREDCTCDNWGTFCYLRDLDSSATWSAAYQPIQKDGDNYEAVFSQGRAEFRRRDFALETHTEIIVSPEDDIELRRIHITNRSRKKRFIEITSYAEIVLSNPVADELHPAFSNLFVQTEFIEHRHAIMCSRRPRSAEEHNPWMFHLMKVHDAEIQQISFETDRAEFIGRGNTINDPIAVRQNKKLAGGVGSVLDPVVSIQYRIYIEPHESAIIDMIFGIAETKELCSILVEKYQDRNFANRGLELAWTHSQVILRQINAVEADVQLYNRLASSLIFANASLRTDSSTIVKNYRGQSGLWSFSISGDLPIVLLQIEDATNIELVRQLVQAHAYWRLKGLHVDLV
ncbi:MAG TPA: glucoamylase family protein, partial [Chitinophagaceae bacterium]|nr:glucoamylase family protein [Chitinophagaceae bacterium]